MPKSLTDFAVKTMKPGAARREIPDGGQRSLYLIVQTSGAKSWAVRYRHAGRAKKLTLPGGLTLAQARKLASDAMFKVAQGIDPIAEKREEQEKALLADETTVRAICENYMHMEGRELRSAAHRESYLRRIIYPAIGHYQIGDLDRDAITKMLDKAVKENGKRAADMALAILSKICNWHETRTSKFRSPIVKGMTRSKSKQERARDRILSDDEVRKIWDACSDERLAVYGQCVRFLLLTAGRRNEATGLHRGEIGTMRSKETGTDFVAWQLPASRSKSKKEVVRPLSAAARSIAESMPVIEGVSDHVFTVSGNRPIALNNPGIKALLDEISGVTNWRYHDLRRTARSIMSRKALHISSDVAELCLGHVLPGGLVRKTYDRYDYLDDKAEAFDRLAAEIERIVTGDVGAKVIRPVFGGQ